MGWYAVHTKPLCEADVAYALRWKVGLEVLWLHYSAWISHARRRRLVLRSYFPRYLFARLDARDIGEVSRMEGVSTIVHGAGSDAIPDGVIGELRAFGDAAGCVSTTEAAMDAQRRRYEQGERVQVNYGGKLREAAVDVDSGGKIVLLVEMFGRVIPATVPPGEVVPLHPECGAVVSAAA